MKKVNIISKKKKNTGRVSKAKSTLIEMNKYDFLFCSYPQRASMRYINLMFFFLLLLLLLFIYAVDNLPNK